LHRAKLDNNEKLHNFCNTLETVIIDTVRAGHMTKDLAICVHNTNDVSRDQWMTTTEFMNKIGENLKAKLSA